MTRTTLSNLLRLLELEPPIRQMLQDGLLSAGHGRALLALAPAQRLKVAKEAVAHDLSVREIEARAKQRPRRPRPAAQARASRDTLRLCEELSAKLGMQVSISGSGKAGKLTISYRSLDSLEALVRLLRKFR